jgi:serine protease Do
MKIVNKIVFYTVILIAAGVLSGFFAPTPLVSKVEASKMVPSNFDVLAKKVSPAVVNIRTVKTVRGGGYGFHRYRRSPFGEDDPFNDFFEKFFGGVQPRDFKQRSLGSGFIIDPEGYIVTNNHVVDEVDKITVVLATEEEYDAKIIGCDPYTDIALIKIDADRKLPYVELGDSDDLKVGEWVVAIGNPFGLSHTVTAGIVSAKGRVIGSGPYDDFIQTDASINPGNSGGPLIDMNGRVIGINTMIIAGGNDIGFAIPINLAKGIIRQLRNSGNVTRGWLGVTIQDLKGEIAQYYGIKGDKRGVLVLDVVSGDPADTAGIKPKDIIIAVNGKKVKTSKDLTARIANIGVGETVKIKVLRDGKEMIFKVKVGERPDTFASSGHMQKKHEELGIRVAKITPQIARRFNISEDAGIIVVDVRPASKADEAGIAKGDIILEINRKEVNSVRDFKKILRSVKRGETLHFLIQRMHYGLMLVHIKK